MKTNLNEECAEILRTLLVNHRCLCPDSPYYGAYDSDDAEDVVIDLIKLINESDEIKTAHKRNDWGK